MSTPVDIQPSFLLKTYTSPSKEVKLSECQVSNSSTKNPSRATGVFVNSAHEQILNTEDTNRTSPVNFFLRDSKDEENEENGTTQTGNSLSTKSDESTSSKNKFKSFSKFIKTPFKRSKSDTMLQRDGNEVQMIENNLTTIAEDTNEYVSKVSDEDLGNRRYRKISGSQGGTGSKGSSKMQTIQLIRSKSEVGFTTETCVDSGFSLQVASKNIQDEDATSYTEGNDSDTEVSKTLIKSSEEIPSNETKEKEPGKLAKSLSSIFSSKMKKTKSANVFSSKEDYNNRDKQRNSLSDNPNAEISSTDNQQEKRHSSKVFGNLLNFRMSRSKSAVGFSNKNKDNFQSQTHQTSANNISVEQSIKLDDAPGSGNEQNIRDDDNLQRERPWYRSLSELFTMKRSKSEMGFFTQDARKSSISDEKTRRKSENARRFAAQNAGYDNSDNSIEIRERGGVFDKDDYDISEAQDDSLETDLNVSVMYRTSFDFKRSLKFGECDISAVCITSTGYVLVLDRLSGKLRMFDQKYQCVSVCDAEGCTSMIKLTDKRFALTCQKEILFCRMKHKHLKMSSKSLDIGYKMHDITYARKHYMVVCHWYDNMCRIHILTRFKGRVGSHWTTLNAVGDISGHDVSTDVCLAADSRKNLFFVTDSRKCFIAAVTFRGRVVFCTTVDWVPRGITTYKQYLIVCNITKRSFYLIDRRGIVEKTLINNLHENPGYVCVDNVKDKLVFSSIRTKTLRVYDLIYIPVSVSDVAEC